jgi:small subunit ribosomal protein S16
VGFHNPVARGQEEVTRINMQRVDFWMEQGAQPTERVAGLIKIARKVAV